jgi:D-serine deaminase-like pyridoxal phosphate-dependent protein
MTQPVAGAISLSNATRERVRREYGLAIGRRREELVTPALVLDIDVAQRNIDRMAERLRSMPARIRPHIKVHKSPELALRQIEAGAIGLSTATVWEAVVMAAAGIDDLFIVNEIAGAEKIRVVAELARERRVLVAVDDRANAEAVSTAALRAGSVLGAMIEIDTGMDRCGVDTPEEALALAEYVAGLPGLRLEGVTGYEGHCSSMPEADLRAQREKTAMSFFVSIADLLRSKGLPCPIVSAGGTGTWELTAQFPGVTEIQAGTYVVIDKFHGHMAPDFEFALTVQARVISRVGHRLTVDAGNKSMGVPALCEIQGHDLPVFRFDEEHGLFDVTAGTRLRVGDSVALVPGYSPATVNWYDAYYVVQDDVVVDIWPVIPRGPGHHGLAVS